MPWKFSHAYIESLRPADKPVDSRKEDGLFLRVSNTGRRTWYLYWEQNKKRKRIKLADYSTEHGLKWARTERDRLKHDIRWRGIYPAEERDIREAERRAAELRMILVSDLIDTFLADPVLSAKPGHKQRNRVMGKARDRWRGVPIDDIDRSIVSQFLDSFNGAPMQAQALKHVTYFFNWLIETGRREPGTSPTAGLRRETSKPRQRVLTDDEIRHVWLSLDTHTMTEPMRLAIKVCLLTAQRPGEVASMRAADIDGEWWTHGKTKNGVTQRVYLARTTRDAIQRARDYAAGSEYVFISSGKRGHITREGMSDKFRQLRDSDYTLYDIRRTVATNLGKLRVSRFDQDRVLNHADNTIGAVYDVYSYDRERRKALEKWERKLLKIIAHEPKTNNVVQIA